MIAIWPVGPPKLMKPSFSQKRSASEKEIIRGPLMAQCRQARVPAALYRHHLNVDAVQALQRLGADHLLRRADLQRAPLAEQEGAVRAQQRVVRIVAREENRDAGRSQLRDFSEHPDLVAEVEAGGGLVHHQQPRLLRQRAGDERELALAARDFSDRLVGELCYAQRLERPLGDLPIALARRRESPQARSAAHQHELAQRESEVRAMALRHVARPAGDFLARKVLDGVSFKADKPRMFPD